MRLASLFLVLGTAALATPPEGTVVLVARESDPVLGMEVLAALKTSTGTTLDACWTRASVRSVKVELRGGRVAKVDPIGEFAATEKECLSRTLQGKSVGQRKGISVVTLELRPASQRDRLARLSGADALGVAQAGGGLTEGEGRTVPFSLQMPKPSSALAEPKLSVTTTSVEGALSAEDVNRILKARAGAFRTCFAADAGLGGPLTMRLAIASDGAVTTATQSSSPHVTSSVEPCVRGILVRCQFPKTSEGATADVQFSLTPQE